jgi:hypothetical protein
MGTQQLLDKRIKDMASKGYSKADIEASAMVKFLRGLIAQKINVSKMGDSYGSF